MKQYDILIGESGGKESHLSQTFQKALDEAYNMGIEHALSIVIDWWNDDRPNVTHLRQRIEALKKPTK